MSREIVIESVRCCDLCNNFERRGINEKNGFMKGFCKEHKIEVYGNLYCKEWSKDFYFTRTEHKLVIKK